MGAGLIGAIFGTAMGILGATIGIYNSIKNTNGPRERAFIIRASIVMCIVLVLLMLGLFLIPKPYNFFLFLPYSMLMLFGIRYTNNHQSRIRAEENQQTSIPH